LQLNIYYYNNFQTTVEKGISD